MSAPVRFQAADQVEGINFPEAPAENIFFQDEEPDAYAKILAYCETSDGDGKLAIYRVRDNQKEHYLTQINLSEFDPDLIKTRFGGGKFVVKGYNDKKRIAMRQWLSIEGDPIIEKPKPETPLAPQVANSSGIDAQTILTIMQENNRQMLQGLAQIMKPVDTGNSRAQMLEEMRIMRDVFMPAQPVQSQQSATDMLLKGIELARTLNPLKSDGETTGMDVLAEAIRSFAPAIGAVVQQATTAPRPNPAPRQSQAQIASPSPVMVSAMPAQLQPQAENEDDKMFKYYVNMLVGFAKSDSDPALYADLIADRMTDDQIMILLNKPDLLGELIAINPEIGQYRVWFTTLIDELRLIMGLTEPGLPNTIEQPTFVQSAQNVPINAPQAAGSSPNTSGPADSDDIANN